MKKVETEKITQNYVKETDFWLNLYEICGFLGNVKNDRHRVDISQFSRNMNDQLLDVPAS